jgi:hypothetical protein
MTESSTPSKFAKWKRPLIGGLLSGGMALLISSGVTEGLFDNLPEFFWGIYELAFNPYVIATPALLIGLDFFADQIFFSGVFIAWFIIGAIIAHFFRRNWLAIICWFIVDAILYIFLIWTCFIC